MMNKYEKIYSLCYGAVLILLVCFFGGIIYAIWIGFLTGVKIMITSIVLMILASILAGASKSLIERE